MSCISFDSYIKPQRIGCNAIMRIGCISFDSYIKPQREQTAQYIAAVVYLLIPTSNHNFSELLSELFSVVYLLIPTSNHNGFFSLASSLSVVYLLIPTSNHNSGRT